MHNINDAISNEDMPIMPVIGREEAIRMAKHPTGVDSEIKMMKIYGIEI